MQFRRSWLQPAVLLFGYLFIANIHALADDIKLRDGVIIKADQVWERNGEIWYRQGSLIQSLPKSEVLQIGNFTAGQETPSIKNPARKTTRHSASSQPVKKEAATAPIATPATNIPNVTRIVFKDGFSLDADATWEVEDRVGYRLGTMQAYVEKSEVARLIPNYALSIESKSPQVTTPVGFSTGHLGLDQLILQNGAKQGVDPLLIYFVMRQESSFNHRAVSRAGALGLMQLMPGTARQLGVRNIHDPVENVEAGTRYLKNLLDKFSGNIHLALAAYNAGEDAVLRYGNRVPPYRETINYVRKISWAYYRAKQ